MRPRSTGQSTGITSATQLAEVHPIVSGAYRSGFSMTPAWTAARDHDVIDLVALVPEEGDGRAEPDPGLTERGGGRFALSCLRIQNAPRGHPSGSGTIVEKFELKSPQ